MGADSSNFEVAFVKIQAKNTLEILETCRNGASTDGDKKTCTTKAKEAFKKISGSDEGYYKAKAIGIMDKASSKVKTCIEELIDDDTIKEEDRLPYKKGCQKLGNDYVEEQGIDKSLAAKIVLQGIRNKLSSL